MKQRMQPQHPMAIFVQSQMTVRGKKVSDPQRKAIWANIGIGEQLKRALNANSVYGVTWQATRRKSGGTSYMLSPPKKDKKGKYLYPDYFIEMHPHPYPNSKTWQVTVQKKRVPRASPDMTIFYKRNMTKDQARIVVLNHMNAINMGLE